jgi:hypothetical protein
MSPPLKFVMFFWANLIYGNIMLYMSLGLIVLLLLWTEIVQDTRGSPTYCHFLDLFQAMQEGHLSDRKFVFFVIHAQSEWKVATTSMASMDRSLHTAEASG